VPIAELIERTIDALLHFVVVVRWGLCGREIGLRLRSDELRSRVVDEEHRLLADFSAPSLELHNHVLRSHLLVAAASWEAHETSIDRVLECLRCIVRCVDSVREAVARTIAYYDRVAEAFRDGTSDHDVSQNYEALLRAIERPLEATEQRRSLRILDFGCGPGRDLAWFRSQGHEAIGLDGSLRFVEMARESTGCEVLHQDFLALDLATERFDGVFANASLFHVPKIELPRVLRVLHNTLVPRGVLFASNPRGPDTEEFSGGRFGAFHSLEGWRACLIGAGFIELEHYYRPLGKPREQQPWLATVWRKP
jgi:SAM-dependent methyltransferase